MSDPFVGQIQMLAFNFAPRSWAFCNGALIAVSQNNSLFSLLGATYGGDARTTFGLPNLTSRMPTGFNMGNAAGLQAFPLGHTGGAQTHTLSQAELPSHTHSATYTPIGGGSQAQVDVTTDTGDTATPSAGAYLAAPSDIPGPDKPEEMFKSDPSAGSLVALGGVSGGGGGDGTVTIQSTGASQAFSLMNPFTAVNFCIALEGVYPPRS